MTESLPRLRAGRLSKIAAGVMLVGALSGCASNNPVDLEARSIAIEQNAVPVSGGPVTVNHLLPAVGPAYVTLNVKETANADRIPDVGNRAITSGSGYVVQGDGLVMTAAHVAVEMGNEIQARAGNGRVYSGKVIAINPTNDMALIKLRGFSGVSVKPAMPGCVAPNNLVFTLGRPHAQSDTARIGELQGRHFGRAVAYGKFGYPDALVLKMDTKKGESGGPLFDSNGRFIGMVVSTLTDANGNLINVAHAVPSTAIAKFLCQQTSCEPQWVPIAQASVDKCDQVASQ
ncbi:MAG: trypsin-like peptidase domain-containing protein [Rhizobiales bacterium]|nr:trypsin-like peptidase domain-containing protein [Hyphomicrobiales bacterium]